MHKENYMDKEQLKSLVKEIIKDNLKIEYAGRGGCYGSTVVKLNLMYGDEKISETTIFLN